MAASLSLEVVSTQKSLSREWTCRVVGCGCVEQKKIDFFGPSEDGRGGSEWLNGGSERCEEMRKCMTQCEQKRHNGDSFEEEPTMRNMKVREDGSDPPRHTPSPSAVQPYSGVKSANQVEVEEESGSSCPGWVEVCSPVLTLWMCMWYHCYGDVTSSVLVCLYNVCNWQKALVVVHLCHFSLLQPDMFLQISQWPWREQQTAARDQENVDLPLGRIPDAAASDSLSGLLWVSAHMIEHQGAPYLGEEVNFCNSFCLLPEPLLSEGFPLSWSGFENFMPSRFQLMGETTSVDPRGPSQSAAAMAVWSQGPVPWTHMCTYTHTHKAERNKCVNTVDALKSFDCLNGTVEEERREKIVCPDSLWSCFYPIIYTLVVNTQLRSRSSAQPWDFNRQPSGYRTKSFSLRVGPLLRRENAAVLCTRQGWGQGSDLVFSGIVLAKPLAPPNSTILMALRHNKIILKIPSKCNLLGIFHHYRSFSRGR